MQTEDYPIYKTIMEDMFAIFGIDERRQERLLTLYWSELSSMTIEGFDKACGQAKREGREFPMISQLLSNSYQPSYRSVDDTPSQPDDESNPVLSREENARRMKILADILDGKEVEREDWIHPSVFERQERRKQEGEPQDEDRIVKYGASHASDPWGEASGQPMLAYEEAVKIRGMGRPWTPEERAEGMRKRRELLKRMGIAETERGDHDE